MKLDSTDSLSIAGGELDNGQALGPAPEERECLEAKNWCYMVVHYSKVGHVASVLEQRFRTFVHKTVTYVKRDGKVERQEKPSVSGLVFVQGVPDDIKSFLKDELPHHFLSNDCSTKRTAVIRDSEMRFFMQTMEVEPTRIRFLEKPFEYYGRYYPQIQMTSGPFAGKKGFIVRIHRDRHFVMQFGNMAIAVSGIHKESFVNSPQKQMDIAKLENSDALLDALNG
jgi:hypothetical protein